MTTVNTIATFIDTLLNVNDFPKDPSNNGLQVLASDTIKKIGFCVDASISFFDKAALDDCDMVIVHHGISWGNGFKRITDDMTGRRITALFNNKLSLYAVHLPLDAHPKYGHNAVISKMLGLKNTKPFGEYVGYKIGFQGELPATISLTELVKNIDLKLDTKCKVFGAKLNQKVKTIGIISGGAADEIADADKLGLDVYITGEMNHYHAHAADELKPALITAGHYKTEIPGIKAIMDVIKSEFDIECIFYDLPTGL